MLPLSVRASFCPSVCPSVIKIWCPLNNFWKTASIQFKFNMLIYNIKTQVELDLGYNPLIFDGVIGLLKKNIVQKLVSAQLAGAFVSYGHISSHRFKTQLFLWYLTWMFSHSVVNYISHCFLNILWSYNKLMKIKFYMVFT